MAEPLRAVKLDLLGGHPALDFTNTIDWRDRATEEGGAEECLISYDALLAWAERACLIDREEAAGLQSAAGRAPDRAAAALSDAIALREAIYGLITAARNKRAAASRDIELLNSRLAAGTAPFLLAQKHGRYVWSERKASSDLDVVAARLARAAAELLTSDQMDHIGCCAGRGCGWLFLDTSANRRRRWCSMEGCGNRAKAKRHYQRVRKKTASPDPRGKRSSS